MISSALAEQRKYMHSNRKPPLTWRDAPPHFYSLAESVVPLAEHSTPTASPVRKQGSSGSGSGGSVGRAAVASGSISEYLERDG